MILEQWIKEIYDFLEKIISNQTPNQYTSILNKPKTYFKWKKTTIIISIFFAINLEIKN